MLAITGAVEITDAEGRELGEEPLHAQILETGAAPTAKLPDQTRAAADQPPG